MNTFFQKPRTKKYAEIVSLKNPEEARGSVEELKKEFKNSNRSKQLRIARVTNLAARRANAQLKRENLSSQESEEFRDIEVIYDNAAKEMFKELKK